MKYVLMIGTAPQGKGGVAAVVSVYVRSGLFDHFPVHYVATHREGGRLSKLVCALSATAQIAVRLLSGRVALVHAHSASNASFKRKSFYLALARALRVPTIFHLHGGGFRDFADQQASPRLRSWIVHTIRHSTRVIALSQAWSDYLTGLAPGARVAIVANPVDVPAELPIRSVEPARLLFLGRASQAKGIFDLLQAMASLKPRWPDLRLALGGDGDLAAVRTYASQLGLAESLDILGWVGEDDKRKELLRAEIFVLPSYKEGLPMAMLEAMAMAVPVVVTPVGGIPEAVQHEQQGLLVDPGQPQALADAIERLLASPVLRERLATSARERVRERFGVELVLQRLSAVYRELGAIERPMP
nr:glycosyltransferase family 4 protein [uncultured Roseateles sp.]